LRARIAWALSEPKLMAEMLNTLALYGWVHDAALPMSTRKSCEESSVGAID